MAAGPSFETLKSFSHSFWLVAHVRQRITFYFLNMCQNDVFHDFKTPKTSMQLTHLHEEQEETR